MNHTINTCMLSLLILCLIDICNGLTDDSWRAKNHELVNQHSVKEDTGVNVIGNTHVRHKRASGGVTCGSLNAEFYKVYRETVQDDALCSYTFTEITNFTAAVRLHVSARDANAEFPVLFVVKEQRSILAWQVPLLLGNSYEYFNVSRTLCPLNKDDAAKTPQQEISIDVSSMSNKPITFDLMAELVYMELFTGEESSITITPSEPKYYRYSFPADVSSVVVKIESGDGLCMVLSVQDIHCPVFDLTRNVEFSGSYQTVTNKGAITVPKELFKKWDAFFIVLVVKPNDYDCYGIEKISPSLHNRRKTVSLEIVPSISEQQYLGAIIGAVAWFFVFYVAAFVISIIYYFTDQARAEPLSEHESSGQSEEYSSIRPTYRRDSQRRLVTPTSPINPLDEGSGTSYGAIASSEGHQASGYADFGGKTNGIPHRIPPPEEADSDDASELDENEVDMLHDIEQEKDVFRTKTFLYVADLARKPRQVLAKKYRLYHWNLITIAIFYGLPVIQLVITYQTVLHVTGNEDICYYNFNCARPLGVLSAFNNVFSNVGYVMLGMLFLLLVWRRDRMHRRLVQQNDRFEKHYGIPQHFGLFYAMGIALAMEGILSGCYHVCPSYSNFQFDTSFMYMIAWLCMLKIYQTRHPDINANAHTAYFAISLVIFLAVLGVVQGGDVLTAYWYLFSGLHLLTVLTISIHIYYMGRYSLDLGVFKRMYLLVRADRLHCMKPMYMDRMILLILGNAVNWSFAIYGIIEEPRDFASYLLAIFIVNLLMYFAFYIIMKLRNGEKILPVAMIFTFLASIVWAFAFYFFLEKHTSWQHTPAVSREGNADCILLDFYDDHDIWHFLSSTSLFFSFMVLLTLDDDLVHVPRDRIPVF